MGKLSESVALEVKQIVIANAASLSGEVDLEAYRLVGIHMPAAWTAANLTFQAAPASAGTFNDVTDDAGVEVLVTAAAAKAIVIGTATKAAIGLLRFIKIRSGTGATPVAQGAERILTLILKR